MAVALSSCYARFCLWTIHFILRNLQVTMWADVVLDYMIIVFWPGALSVCTSSFC